MAKKQIVASTFNVTAAPEDGAKGSRGQLPYPAGEYDLHTDYICTDMVAPYVLYNGIYYVMNQITTWIGHGVPSNINNPQKDYAVNGTKATWIPFESYKAIYVEILMANFAKLASAVFSGDYMFSQQGVDADGNSTSNYKEFYMGTFTPNLLLDFAIGLFKGNNVEVNGGVFKNIRSPNNSFKIKENGDIEIVGRIETSFNGKRVVIDPETNSIKMYNQSEQEVLTMSFMDSEWNGEITSIPRLRMQRIMSSGVVTALADVSPGSIALRAKGIDVFYDMTISPISGITFLRDGVVTKSYPTS
ncbi:hypothetical protein [Bacteroides sp. 14(A)]|uniref:hypothetical protein n=1 Tax=Bacteroides sp. 14(A) TaxID=1163670 RepID=UPI000494128B|nr:hypothetical protein [Bacteroides sp. 14(A)]